MKYVPLFLVLAPCVLLSQEKQKNRAEALFKELEAKLSKADTIQCKYRAVMQVKEGEREKEASKAEGLLLLQKGNKLHFRLDGQIGLQNPGKVEFTSDGTTVATVEHKAEKRDPYKEKAPANLGSAFSASLAREGLLAFVATHIGGGTLAENIGDEQDRKKVPPSGFRARGKERIGEVHAEVIEFRTRVPREKGPSFRVTLALHPKTSLPVKRVVKLEADGKKVWTVTETYEDWKLDEKIDPAKFKVP